MIAPFVDATFLDARPDAVLADCRFYLTGESAREAYDAGHIAGAIFIDFDATVADMSIADRGRHPLPSPERFADALGAAGIGDHDVVVAYDDAGGVIAARLVWMLRAIGRDAALLDGGLQAWEGQRSTTETVRPPADFTATPWPEELLADADAAASRDNLVIDARPAGRYAGDPDPYDPRAGHVPGTLSLPCRDHLGDDLRLAEEPELRASFAAVGIDRSGLPVVSSCGAGVTACHNLLVMEHLGLGRGRLYPGSWSEYSRTNRPLATGPDPG